MTRILGSALVAVVVMVVSILTLTQTMNAATLAGYDTVASATDSSPPVLAVVEHGTVGTTASWMSMLAGAVPLANHPGDGRDTLAIPSIWLLPVALVGVGVLARPLLLGSGNSYPARRLYLQKGDNRRASAGMRPSTFRGFAGA